MNSGDAANYIFCSWARIGVANQITTADDFGSSGGSGGSVAKQRAQLQLKISLDGVAKVTSPTVFLYGPGDITGIDKRVILSTVPKDGSDNFESNYFPAIEFSEADMLWRYTPLGPGNGGLRPWICLIVLKGSLKSPGPKDEFTSAPPSPTVPLWQITVKSPSSLPDLTESQYWAHVQIAAPQGSDLSQYMQDNPSLVRSRLLCPRRLEESTHYTAFVVPVFRMGAQRGLGEDVTDFGTDNAWDVKSTTQVVLPVYYSWEFSTGPGGDFESLVLQLTARDLSNAVGTRSIDGNNPYPEMNFPSAGQLALSGALISPNSTIVTPSEPPTFTNQLLNWLNSASKLSTPPVVAPPVYGKWYTNSVIIDSSSPPWLYSLNVHPSYRIPAGFGAEVVRKNRLQLLSAAWMQAAGIQKANETLRHAQLSREVLTRMHTKYITSASVEKSLAFTSSVHNKILLSPKTAGYAIRQSPIPKGALSVSMQKAVSPLRPLRSRQNKPQSSLPGMLSRLNSGDLNPTPPAPEPTETSTIDGVTETFYPPWIPKPLRPFLPYLVWLLWLLIPIIYLLGILVLGLSAFSPALLSIAVLLFAVGAAAWRFYSSLGPIINFTSSNLTQETIQSIPPRTSFTIVAGSQPPVPASSGVGQENPVAARFRIASSAAQGFIRAAYPPAPIPTPIDIQGTAVKVNGSLHPETTVKDRIIPLLILPPGFAWSPGDPLQQVVIGPSIAKAMYEPLVKISSEAFLPGLGTVPENTVAVLITNPRFVEAYMVGVNHEMSKLLMFNGYPTDPRYTYFQQFWDKSISPAGQNAQPDINPILFWPTGNDLGQNGENPASDQNNLVLMIYGKLLRRYPDTIVFAAHINVKDEKRTISSDEHHPVFRCSLPPDITLLGFDITKPEVLATPTDPSDLGFYFVIQQPPSSPEFGLEQDDWINLALSSSGYINVKASAQNHNLPQPPDGVTAAWGNSSGDMAAITYRERIQVAYKATPLITPQGGG